MTLENQFYFGIFRFMTPIILGGLDDESARRLIVEPMERLGLKVKDEVVKKILKETSNHPALIQFYCKRLIALLDKMKKREVLPEEFKKIQQEEDVEDAILRNFLANTDEYGRIIIYLWIKQGWEGVIDVERELSDIGIYYPRYFIDKKIEGLQTADIIVKKGNNYFFTQPSLPDILKKKYNLDFEIECEKRKVIL